MNYSGVIRMIARHRGRVAERDLLQDAGFARLDTPGLDPMERERTIFMLDLIQDEKEFSRGIVRRAELLLQGAGRAARRRPGRRPPDRF